MEKTASPQPVSAQARRRLSARDTFAALRHPIYRLWFIGQLVSLAGTWMQTTAQGYLVYELTKSPAFLGYVGFAAGIPSWLFTLYGGVLADRIPRRTLLVITQSAMMVLAFILAALTFTRLVQPWHIIALAFLLGIANAFDAPARQSFVLEMVAREDMTNAIALNSTMFNSAAAVGPAIAGLTYAALGPAWCFTLNGVSFIAVIASLLLMKIKPIMPRISPNSALADIKAAFGFVARHRVVRTTILNLAVVSLFGFSFATLIPAWAVEILKGDAATNGFMQSARGLGALTGGLMLATIGGYTARGRLVTLGSLALPLLLLAFSGVRWLPLSLVTLAGIGWAFLVLANSTNALIQTLVPDELRGRVMSVFTLSFFGLAPVGSLIAGGVAARLGEPAAVALGALVVLGFAVLVWVRVPEVRSAV